MEEIDSRFTVFHCHLTGILVVVSKGSDIIFFLPLLRNSHFNTSPPHSQFVSNVLSPVQYVSTVSTRFFGHQRESWKDSWYMLQFSMVTLLKFSAFGSPFLYGSPLFRALNILAVRYWLHVWQICDSCHLEGWRCLLTFIWYIKVVLFYSLKN